MDTTAAIEPPVNNPSTLRVRRHRQRRRERVRLLSVELPGHFIDAAIARGLLDADDCTDAWAAIQACYAALLSDKALDLLIGEGVITREQRGDAAAILRGINDWLESAQPCRKIVVKRPLCGM